VQATMAPRALPSWMAMLPIPPAPPWTSSTSPGASLAWPKTLALTVHATSGSGRIRHAHPVRDGQQLPGGHGGQFRVTAAGHQRADAVTLAPAGHARPDPGDPAGTLQSRIGGSAGRRRVEALPLHDIRRVHAGRRDLDQHLAFARDRIRYLLQAEYLGPAGGGDDDSAHGQLQKPGHIWVCDSQIGDLGSA